VDDHTIIDYNKRYLNHTEATDVISFPDGEFDPETECVHLGDILVSIETARNEAKSRRKRVRDEIVLYALHGLLHLLGMTDTDEASRRAMFRAQRNELARYGITE